MFCLVELFCAVDAPAGVPAAGAGAADAAIVGAVGEAADAEVTSEDATVEPEAGTEFAAALVVVPAFAVLPFAMAAFIAAS
jgi:hypothetical protein